MAGNSGGITIRRMRQDEKKDVRALMRRVFPFLTRLFFTITRETFVAERDGMLLGGVVTRTFRIDAERTGGLVAFIFTAAEARGSGIGQGLVARALSHFEEQGCSVFFASVEGTNTSSSKLFLTRGFTLASGGRLISKYRFSLFRIFWHTFHLFDLGHFLWIKDRNTPAEEYRERPARQWMVNLAWNTLCWTTAFALRGSAAPEGAPPVGAAVLIALALLLSVRDLSTLAAAKLLRLPLCYRLWETGLLLNTVIALVFRGQFISTGSFYPTRHDWRYTDERSRLGKIALVSNLVSLAFLYLLLVLRFAVPLPTPLSFLSGMMLLVGAVLIVFDMLLPIFPFSASNAGRIFNWRKPAWFLTALLGAGFLFLREMLY